LTYWRRRLAVSDRPNRIFDAVRRVVAETGVLTGRTRRVLDSTILDDAVATQDTVTQLIGGDPSGGSWSRCRIRVFCSRIALLDWVPAAGPR